MQNAASQATVSQISSVVTTADSLSQLLKMQISSRPDNEAIVFESLRLSYRRLHSHIISIFEQLLAFGLQPSQRVALVFPNHAAYVASFLAISCVGATAVP